MWEILGVIEWCVGSSSCISIGSFFDVCVMCQKKSLIFLRYAGFQARLFDNSGFDNIDIIGFLCFDGIVVWVAFNGCGGT